jgi:hypothetical protein
MAALGSGSDISGSVLLTWHEKVSTPSYRRLPDSLC